MGTLYIIATPIGNLEDITLRALRILREVDLILCEDTRVTKKLLAHYDIAKRVESYHAQSSGAKEERILTLLREGKNLALVSDSGTPAISDPGSRLVAKVRETLGKDAAVAPVPGPSALTTAFSASGIAGGEFLFLGFLPHKKGRETLFKEIAASERAVIFYESPHRLLKTLASLEKTLAAERLVVVAKELTKIYEEIARETAKEMRAYFENHLDKIKGEFVIIVEGRK